MRKVLMFLLGASLVLLGSCNVAPGPGSASNRAFDRIMRSQVIRVGYVAYPPSFIVDPNTKAFSGISYDILQKAADNLSLKLDYVEEVGWSSMIEALADGRVDIIGTSIWPTAARGKRADFITPTFYSYVKAYVREDDKRFDGNMKAADAKDVKIATVDGEISSAIAASDFPLAQKISLPQLSDVTQLLLDVASRKADITFLEPAVASRYIASNPNTIREVKGVPPVRLFPNSFMIAKGEYELKSTMDVAIKELLDSGYVDKVLTKYEAYPGSFGRVASPVKP